MVHQQKVGQDRPVAHQPSVRQVVLFQLGDDLAPRSAPTPPTARAGGTRRTGSGTSTRTVMSNIGRSLSHGAWSSSSQFPSTTITGTLAGISRAPARAISMLAVKDRHRHLGFIPRPQPLQRVEKPANVKGLRRTLARSKTGRNKVKVVVVIAVHRQHLGQTRRCRRSAWPQVLLPASIFPTPAVRRWPGSSGSAPTAATRRAKVGQRGQFSRLSCHVPPFRRVPR